MARGLAEEVRQLLDSGVPRTCTAMQAIGYKELAAAVTGQGDLTAAAEEVKLRSRQYAKRQLTWFRRNRETQWYLWAGKPDFAAARPFCDRKGERIWGTMSGRTSPSVCNREKRHCPNLKREGSAYNMQKNSNLQDVYLASVRKNRLNVTMFLMNGYQLRG